MEATPRDPTVLQLRVTLADQVRMNEWMLDRPELRRKRYATRVAMVLLVPLLGLALGIAVTSIQYGRPFWQTLGRETHDRGSQIIVATMAAAMVTLWSVLGLLRRPLLRRRLRQLLPERPGIDPADPALTEPVRLLLDDAGFVAETGASTTRVPWSAVKELADADTLLVLRTGRYSGFIIPKRNLSATDDAALRAAVARAGRSTP